MGFSVSSRSPCQLKSMFLRTNEEFVRLCNDVANRLYFQRSRVLDDVQDFGLSCFRTSDLCIRSLEWECFQKEIRYVDDLMKRAEKCAQFFEALAVIMLQFEQEVIPVLKKIRSSLDEGDNYGLNFFMQTYSDLEYFLEVFAESKSSGLESAHKLVLLAISILSFVYRYLIGCVDKGGAKTYSPGSFLFRLIFVAIVLFLGSYVWIKSRQASYTASRRKRKSWPLADRASQLGDELDVPGGVYRRAVKDTRGSVTHYKYEPRFKPRREKLESGTSLEFNCLSLGSYDTPREAEIVRHIAAVLYGIEEGRPVQFEDGVCLPLPSGSWPENCTSSGKEKAVWVTHKTKQLYAELLEEKARRLQLLLPTLETALHHGHDGEANRSGPSPSAPGAPSTAIELTCFTPPHGGNGVVEEWATSESHGLGQEPPIAPGVFSTFSSDCDFEQVISSIPHWQENDLPAMDDLDQIVGDFSDTNRFFGFESTLVPPQSSALDIPASAIVARLPQLGGGDRGLEIIEPQLNSATAITFQQLESHPEQVQFQQLVTYQKQRPEEFSGSNVELQQKLLEFEVSELQQKLRKSEVENEKLKSMLRRCRSMFRQFSTALDEDGSPVDIQ